MPVPTDFPSWVSTPDAVVDYIQQISSAVSTLNADILAERTRLTSTAEGGLYLQAWQEFANRYLNWTQTLEASDMFWGGATADRAEEFAREYNGFEERFSQLTGRAPTRPEGQEYTPEGDGFPWKWVIGGALVVGGLAVVAYLLRSTAVVKEAFEPNMSGRRQLRASEEPDIEPFRGGRKKRRYVKRSRTVRALPAGGMKRNLRGGYMLEVQ